MKKQLVAPVRFKAVSAADAAAGIFEAIVSVFNNIDRVGDMVIPGAFVDDLDEWKASGNPIPVIFSHRWEDPEYHIGYVLDAKEIDEGLWVRGQLDIEGNDPEDAKARKAFKLLKSGRITQFSFAYDVLEAAWVTVDGQDVYELRKLHVHEVGPCLVGVNSDTRLLTAKAGRVLSQKNVDALSEARDLIAGVLDAANTDEGKATASEPAKAHADDPRRDPVRLLTTTRIMEVLK